MLCVQCHYSVPRSSRTEGTAHCPVFKDMQNWGNEKYHDDFPHLPFPDKPTGPDEDVVGRAYRDELVKVSRQWHCQFTLFEYLPRLTGSKPERLHQGSTEQRKGRPHQHQSYWYLLSQYLKIKCHTNLLLKACGTQ